MPSVTTVNRPHSIVAPIRRGRSKFVRFSDFRASSIALRFCVGRGGIAWHRFFVVPSMERALDDDITNVKTKYEPLHRKSSSLFRKRSKGREPSAFYLLRHGERADEVDESDPGYIGGTVDPPLTARGVAMAEEAANRIAELQDKEHPIYAIYCSPYVRCIQTAVPIARKLQLPIRIETGLSECKSCVSKGEELVRRITDRRVKDAMANGHSKVAEHVLHRHITAQGDLMKDLRRTMALKAPL